MRVVSRERALASNTPVSSKILANKRALLARVCPTRGTLFLALLSKRMRGGVSRGWLLAFALVLMASVAACASRASARARERPCTRWEFTYTLQPYRRACADVSGADIFRSLSAHVGGDSKRRIALVGSLLAVVPRLVWGVQTRSTRWSVELYIYHPRVGSLWSRLRRALEGHYRCLLPETLDVAFAPRMLSFDLPGDPGDGDIAAVDVYDIQSPTRGVCFRCTARASPYLKNTYAFALRGYDPERVAFETPPERGTEERVALPPGIPLLFAGWRISLCLAQKRARSHTGVYCSGVPVADLLASEHAPERMRRTLERMATRSVLVDVGYDVGPSGSIETFCLYGACTRSATARPE